MNNHTFSIQVYGKKLKTIFFLSFFCFITGVLQVQAKEMAYAQSKKFTLSLENVPIKEFLTYVETHSEFVFFYQPAIVDATTKVTLNVSNETIERTLDKAFKGTQITYEIKDRQIVLKKQQPASPSTQKGQNPKKLVQGLVKDEQGNAIIGANIQPKGTTTGVITNIDGLFSITVPENAVLVFSYIGFVTKEVAVGDNNSLTVVLKEDSKILDEVVVTAFGASQKKETMVGSVEQVKPSDLKVPSSSLSNGFAGRMAGLIAVQSSGEPGADGSSFWIRGKSTFSSASGANSPLIVLDGVEISVGDLNGLDPEAIEGFSILKDATATALYGTRGANGVMIVTTKTGADLLKPIINFRLETSVNELTEVPGMVNGVDYMRLYNEAISTRGGNIGLYSQDKITNTERGGNPLLYPNINWYDEMFNKLSMSERFNFNIRGGKKAVTYFMSASVKLDGGNLKALSKDYFSYDNNIRVNRYDFVNNLRINATKSTTVSLGLNVTMRDWKGPSKAITDVFGISREASPVDFPIRFPAQTAYDSYVLWGGMSGGVNNSGFVNPVAEYVTGYKSTFSSTVLANLNIEQDLSMITKGLKAKALFSFKNYSETNATRTGKYNQFEISKVNEDGTYALSRVGDELNTALTTAGSSTGDRSIYLQAYLDYNRTFGAHDVNAMFLYNQTQFNTNAPSNLLTTLPRRKQGIAGRLSYAYDSRYLAEVNFGYNGSENFAKGHRFGFFPSVAIGYNISQEKFWEPLSNVISHLKLRASWGLVGNDQIADGQRYAYLEDINLAGASYTTGVNQSVTKSGPTWSRYYNPGLGWEVGEKLNFGMDMQLFHDLNIHIDGFKEIRKDIFMQRSGTVPIFVGTGSTNLFANLGKVKNVGFDLSMDYNKQITKNFFLSFKGTFTYAHNTVLEKDEPPYKLYPNLFQVGHSIDTPLLYIANGLIKDDDDLNNSPKQQIGGIVQPGDIKYQNIPNIDGIPDAIIDSNDMCYVGNPTTPEIVYGFGPSMKWKKWDLSLFFQGVAKRSLLMSNFHPFGRTTTRGVMQFIADNYWSESNPNPNAEYPRLSRDTNENNSASSTFWLRNGAFLKLKNAEIGFTHKMFRVYLSGSNLLTFSPFKHWDPEMGGGNGLKYPTTRMYNIGIQFTFK